jgi:hypothetical protein
VLLQGFDTATHFAIVADVCAAHPRLWTHVGAVALVWALHSLICQVTRKSTATLFVEGFKSVLYPPRRASGHGDHAPHHTCNRHDMGEGGEGEAGGRGGDGVDEIPSWAAGTLASPSQLPLADSEMLQASFIASAVVILACLFLWWRGLVSGMVLYAVTSVMVASSVSAYESVRVNRGPQVSCMCQRPNVFSTGRGV